MSNEDWCQLEVWRWNETKILLLSRGLKNVCWPSITIWHILIQAGLKSFMVNVLLFGRSNLEWSLRSGSQCTRVINCAGSLLRIGCVWGIYRTFFLFGSTVLGIKERKNTVAIRGFGCDLENLIVTECLYFKRSFFVFRCIMDRIIFGASLWGSLSILEGFTLSDRQSNFAAQLHD